MRTEPATRSRSIMKLPLGSARHYDHLWHGASDAELRRYVDVTSCSELPAGRPIANAPINPSWFRFSMAPLK